MQAPSEARRLAIGARSFLLEDQLTFARFSGDWNPIHVDPLYARRCLTGQAVVHGMHTLLWAMECWVDQGYRGRVPGRIAVQFIRPVFLDENLECRLIKNSPDHVVMEVTGSSGQLMLAEFFMEPGAAVASAFVPTVLSPQPSTPAAPGLPDLAGKHGSWAIALDPDLTKALFPKSVALWGRALPAMIASASRLVGMECPGQNSLFSELELLAQQSPSGNSGLFEYQVTRVDSRFGLVTLKVAGAGFAGIVKAFLRPEPARQAKMAVARDAVEPQAFAGQRALVVGGSRGLGELAAKLLAGGGADVCLTYHRGSADASAVVEEIVGAGCLATAAQLDATAALAGDWRTPQGWQPTHLYYFATPFIFSGQRAGFSDALFANLCKYYVTGFGTLVGALVPAGLRGALYPSTVALDELPADMAEYCAAKAGGEALCGVLAGRHPGLHIDTPRLPRLATDQTASLLPVGNQNPLPVIRDLLIDFARAT